MSGLQIPICPALPTGIPLFVLEEDPLYKGQFQGYLLDYRYRYSDSFSLLHVVLFRAKHVPKSQASDLRTVYMTQLIWNHLWDFSFSTDQIVRREIPKAGCSHRVWHMPLPARSDQLALRGPFVLPLLNLGASGSLWFCERILDCLPHFHPPPRLVIQVVWLSHRCLLSHCCTGKPGGETRCLFFSNLS